MLLGVIFIEDGGVASVVSPIFFLKLISCVLLLIYNLLILHQVDYKLFIELWFERFSIINYFEERLWFPVSKVAHYEGCVRILPRYPILFFS